jgi:hypothetical protein
VGCIARAALEIGGAVAIAVLTDGGAVATPDLGTEDEIRITYLHNGGAVVADVFVIIALRDV